MPLQILRAGHRAICYLALHRVVLHADRSYLVSPHTRPDLVPARLVAGLLVRLALRRRQLCADHLARELPVLVLAAAPAAHLNACRPVDHHHFGLRLIAVLTPRTAALCRANLQVFIAQTQGLFLTADASRSPRPTGEFLQVAWFNRPAMRPS